MPSTATVDPLTSTRRIIDANHTGGSASWRLIDINVEGWAAIVSELERGAHDDWACPENDDGRVEAREVTNNVGDVVEWHLWCKACGAETHVRRGPAQRVPRIEL